MTAVTATLPAMVTLAALSVAVASAAGQAKLALAAVLAVLAGIALAAQPFLGVATLATFSHLDAVQKALLGFLPVSAFKLIAAATLVAVFLNAPRLRVRVRRVLRTPTVVIAVVFALLAVVSLAGAEDRTLALSALRRLLSLGLLLILTAILADSYAKVSVLLWLLVATSLVSGLILIADFTLGIQIVAQSDAATTARTVEGVARSAGGSDYNPTTAAALLLVGVVFALVHALESPVWRWRLLLVVAIGTVAIVLSFARSAALVYGVIVLTLIWRHRRWRYLPVLALVAAVAALVALPVIPSEYWHRLSAIFGGGGDPTLGRRLSYNLIGIDLFLQNPLFGVGPGNFAHHFTDTAYRFMPGRTLLGRDLHNMYLSVLVQHGLVGAFAFFGILVLSFRQIRAVCAAPADPALRTYALALGYAFAAYLLVSLFLPNEETKYTWLLPGITTALYLLNERERARP